MLTVSSKVVICLVVDMHMSEREMVQNLVEKEASFLVVFIHIAVPSYKEVCRAEGYCSDISSRLTRRLVISEIKSCSLPLVGRYTTTCIVT